VAKPEWGTKRQCGKCGARFYDLANDPIVCPSCGVTHVPEIILKSRAPQAEEAPKPVKAPVKVPDEEVAEVEADDDDEDLEVDDDDDDAVLGEELEDEEDDPVDVRDARGEDD
jgi:uncharacterized protein (TIGR02300 family)